MKIFSLCLARCLFGLIWKGVLSAALVVRVSETGHDNSSCWEWNATIPCKSLGFAQGALRDLQHYNETVFTFLIEDEVYYLEERINIIQTSEAKSVYLKSSNLSVIRCKNKSAGFDIGTRKQVNRTRNIHFQNLEFQNCGPDLAAVVLIWSSVDVIFKNCVFRRNKQAGINAFNSGVTIEGCTFVNNTSNRLNISEEYEAGINSAGGGAGFLFHDVKNVSLTIKDSIFEFNAATMDDSPYYVEPTYNVSHRLLSGGGGLFVSFGGMVEHCLVAIENSTFFKNTATNGGGIFFPQFDMAIRNKITVTNSTFTGNIAGQHGGGLVFTQWNCASSFITIFKNCIFSENRSKRGAGMSVSLTSFKVKPNTSFLR